MFVSVVVPTHNQRDLTGMTIRSLSQQTYPHSEYEIVVIDDGSVDGTREMLRTLEVPATFRHYRQADGGRAAARNSGAEKAGGELLLFIDGDMAVNPSFIEEHVKSHGQHIAHILAMGAIQLAPEVNMTPFTRHFLSTIEVSRNAEGFVPCEHCLTGNLSIRREDFVRLGRFDEGFTEYGWEDTVLGYRAHQMGLRIVYNPKAIAYHYDLATDVTRHATRLMKAAQAAPVVVFTRYPQLRGSITMVSDMGPIVWRSDKLSAILKKLIRAALSKAPILRLLEATTRAVESACPSAQSVLLACYRLIIGVYIFRGYRRGLSELERS